MGILGIHHSTIVVPDLAQAVEFYTRVPGLAVVQEVSLAATPEIVALTELAVGVVGLT